VAQRGKAGRPAYGYTSFSVDLTPALQAGGSNVLAVRIDNSQHKNTRWYSGSGIYRHVWLTVTGPVHVTPWGVYAQALEATPASAKVALAIQVTNATSAGVPVTLNTVLLAPMAGRRAKNKVQGTPAGGRGLNAVFRHRTGQARPMGAQNPRPLPRLDGGAGEWQDGGPGGDRFWRSQPCLVG